MPSPFPGMDPYLERPQLWRDVHHRLITAIGDALAPQVEPDYVVAIEQRTYSIVVDRPTLVSYPDAAVISETLDLPSSRSGGTALAIASPVQTVTLPLYEPVREGYLEIRDVETQEIVTAIELLSPTNKAPGEGRGQYETKRRNTLESLTNLVEIDLLRGGEPMAMEPLPASDYRILVAAGWERPEARLYAFGIRDVVPGISIPLREGETEAVLAIGELLAGLYDRARYQRRVYYHLAAPEPPLVAEDVAWVEELLRTHGLRG